VRPLKSPQDFTTSECYKEIVPFVSVFIMSETTIRISLAICMMTFLLGLTEWELRRAMGVGFFLERRPVVKNLRYTEKYDQRPPQRL